MRCGSLGRPARQCGTLCSYHSTRIHTMPDWKIILGSTAAAISLVAFVPYFSDIVRRKTRPHAFSWLVWSALTGTSFAIQFSEHGGTGAWTTGVTAAGCFTIFLFAIGRGDRKFRAFDWASLGAAAIALGLWLVTDDPTWSVILVILTDVFGFLPTLRKGYLRPHQETYWNYALNSLAFGISILALESYSLTTWLYPAVITFLDGSFAILLIIRRRHAPTTS